MSRTNRAVSAFLMVATLGVSACGGGTSDASKETEKLGDGVEIVDSEDQVVETTDPKSGDSSDTTIPLNEDGNVIDSLFSSMKIFNSCLEEHGVEFLGDPRTAEPGSPAADPEYLETLGTCAAKSKIMDAMTAWQDAGKDLTPEQIEDSNKGITLWKECMIGKGWNVELSPDERGMLQPGIDMTGPNGESALTGADTMKDCADKSQEELEAQGIDIEGLG